MLILVSDSAVLTHVCVWVLAISTHNCIWFVICLGVPWTHLYFVDIQTKGKGH